MPRVLTVNISEIKGQVKHPIDKGYFIVDHGLKGDSHAGKGIKQVSLLDIETLNKMKESEALGLCSVKFTPNLLTEQIMLYKLPIGTKLKIGEVIMEITKIGKECHQGCEIRHKAGDCVIPRECIFTSVLGNGWIKPGDVIEVLR